MVSSSRMSLAHRCICRPSFIVHQLIVWVLTCSMTKGAISATVKPLIHLSFQNSVRSPLPIFQCTKLLKASCTFLSDAIGRPCHGFESSVLFSHSQRNLRASPCLARSMMPSPPMFFGRQTLCHTTRHLPPWISSVLAQKKARQPLSTLSRAHLGASAISK